mgnify:CR=1 FL=1
MKVKVLFTSVFVLTTQLLFANCGTNENIKENPYSQYFPKGESLKTCTVSSDANNVEQSSNKHAKLMSDALKKSIDAMQTGK